MAKKRKGKISTMSDADKKIFDEIFSQVLSDYYKEVQAKKKNLGDYVYVRTVYRDENGRMLKKTIAKERLEKGLPVIVEHRYYLKQDMPEFGLKKGQQIPKKMLEDVLSTIKDDVKRYNTILGVAYAQDISFEEAEKIVDEVFRAYEEGEISRSDVHDILSP